MAYRAKVTFADLQDGKRLYHEGETFPRDGLTVSEKRLASLAGSDNRMGYPLIEYIHDEPADDADEKPVRKRARKDAGTGL